MPTRPKPPRPSSTLLRRRRARHKPLSWRMILVRRRINARSTEFAPAMAEHAPFLPGLSPVGGKPVHVAFDGGRLTSDAGVLVLAEIERQLGLAERLARCIEDPRAPERGQRLRPDLLHQPAGPSVPPSPPPPPGTCPGCAAARPRPRSGAPPGSTRSGSRRARSPPGSPRWSPGSRWPCRPAIPTRRALLAARAVELPP